MFCVIFLIEILFSFLMSEYYTWFVHPQQTEAFCTKVFTELNVLLAFLLVLILFQTDIGNLQFEKINVSVYPCVWMVCRQKCEWTTGNKYCF